MLIKDAKPRIAPGAIRAMREATRDAELSAQRAALERAFARLLAGSGASAALAELLAPRDDGRVH